MERIIRLQIEKLPEGVYLVTSDDVQGLVTEAPTLNEAIEWGRENARNSSSFRVDEMPAWNSGSPSKCRS